MSELLMNCKWLLPLPHSYSLKWEMTNTGFFGLALFFGFFVCLFVCFGLVFLFVFCINWFYLLSPPTIPQLVLFCFVEFFVIVVCLFVFLFFFCFACSIAFAFIYLYFFVLQEFCSCPYRDQGKPLFFFCCLCFTVSTTEKGQTHLVRYNSFSRY